MSSAAGEAVRPLTEPSGKGPVGHAASGHATSAGCGGRGRSAVEVATTSAADAAGASGASNAAKQKTARRAADGMSPGMIGIPIMRRKYVLLAAALLVAALAVSWRAFRVPDLAQIGS